MNSKFKKILLAALCSALCISAFGCGSAEDKKSETNTSVSETQDKAEEADKKNASDTDVKSEENKTENKSENKSEEKSSKESENTTSTEEAPVIESSEQLESMVDEFNTTEDPERKEELRQQLESFLAQAEAQSATVE